nr:TniQ [Citrobacter freundii]
MISLSPPTICNSALNTRVGSVAKIVKLEHAWRRLDGRNDDGFQVAPFPG